MGGFGLGGFSSNSGGLAGFRDLESLGGAGGPGVRVANYVSTADGEGTFPLDTDVDSIKFWFRTTDAKYILFSHTTDGGKYLIGENSASPGTFISASSGTIAVKVDGVTTTDASDLRDGVWHEIEITGIDLSLWTGSWRMGYTGSSWLLNAEMYNLRLFDGGVLQNSYLDGTASLGDHTGSGLITLLASESTFWTTVNAIP
jgi:hypothetical protein